MRPDMGEFQLGVQKAQDAIMSAMSQRLPQDYYYDPISEQEDKAKQKQESKQILEESMSELDIAPAHTPLGRAHLPPLLYPPSTAPAVTGGDTLGMSLTRHNLATLGPVRPVRTPRGTDVDATPFEPERPLNPLARKISPTRHLLGDLYSDAAFLAHLQKDRRLMEV
ncbi:hypothetical protein KIPB_011711, partial [Kipferlia bialata]|eukprot:g11711.t1